MIGSHNSYTYLNSANKLLNWFNFLWRCQDKTIKEQYMAGVRFFDIRIKHIYDDNKAHAWIIAHGLVNLKQVFYNINEIAAYFKNLCPDAKIRIILENNKYKDLFVEQIADVISDDRYNYMVVFACIKKNWEVLWNFPDQPAIKDLCYVPWHSDWSILKNIINFRPSTIRKWAAKHNPEITQEMIDDPDIIYFMDFI